MKKISIMTLLLVVALASCKKTPEVNLKYVDVERDLITVGTTTATVQCDYQYIATLKKAYLYYGEGTEEAEMNAAEMRVVQNTLYVDLAGLKSNTTYCYFYEFHNGFNSMRTVAKTFKTEALPTTVTLPTVVTASVTEITTNSAKGGGEVTNNGGAEVTERGICWSTNENPTLNDNHVAVGSGTGAFTTMMDGLEANTTYHVRAYATNSVGTAYGLDIEFTTLSGGGGGSGNAPIGAIDGLFSVSPTKKVYFSQGNLQYQASTNTWRFAENQWNFVGGFYEYSGITSGNVSGSSNNDISPTYEGWIDLFGWGTSGYNHGATCYQPWSIGYSNNFFYAYGSSNYNLYDQTGQADWGYNAISNGGNIENLWRSLSVEEWVYVIDSRNTNSNIRYSKAIVNDVKGLILMPDNWNPDTFCLNETNSLNASYECNIISASEWTMLENVGVVFLPSAGCRITSTYHGINNTGDYWTASYKDDSHSYQVSVWEGSVQADNYVIRADGLSVRLVQDANP